VALAFVSSHTNGGVDLSSIAVTSVPAGTDRLYIATVGSKSGAALVDTVSGGSLTWNLIKSQCGGRNQTRITSYYAIGSPSSFTCTMDLDAESQGLAMVVDVYDGADTTAPVINAGGENTIGANDTGCSAGSDNGSPNVQFTVGTTATSFGYTVSNTRNKTLTLDSEYTARGSAVGGSGGGQSRVDGADNDTPSSSESADHSCGSTDWCILGMEIVEAPAPDTVVEAPLLTLTLTLLTPAVFTGASAASPLLTLTLTLLTPAVHTGVTVVTPLLTLTLTLFTPTTVLTVTRTQEGSRWRDDDGSESGATWLEAQDTDITRATLTTTRLRVLTDMIGNAPSEALSLQYRKVGDADSEWRDVPL
jgi:hypothetical protein